MTQQVSASLNKPQHCKADPCDPSAEKAAPRLKPFPSVTSTAVPAATRSSVTLEWPLFAAQCSGVAPQPCAAEDVYTLWLRRRIVSKAAAELVYLSATACAKKVPYSTQFAFFDCLENTGT